MFGDSNRNFGESLHHIKIANIKTALVAVFTCISLILSNIYSSSDVSTVTPCSANTSLATDKEFSTLGNPT